MKNKKNKMKGNYGIKIERFILKHHYNSDNKSKNYKYDLPKEINHINNLNVSIKSTSQKTFSCSSLDNFLSSEDLEMILVQYEILENDYIKIIIVYTLNPKETKIIRDDFHDLISIKQLQNLKEYFFSLNNLIKPKKPALYVKMSRELDRKTILTINCKFNSKNHRIQCSLSLKALNKHFFMRMLKKFSGIIFNPQDY